MLHNTKPKIYDNISSLLITFLLFGLPFLVLPFGTSWFEIPKVIVGEACIVILLILNVCQNLDRKTEKPITIAKLLNGLIARIKKVKTIQPRQTWLKQFNNLTIPSHTILILLFLFSIFHLIFLSSDVMFFGNQFRLQGILLLWCLMVFAIVSSRVKLWLPPKIIIFCLLIVQLVLSIFWTKTIDNRAVGTLGEPNALAGYVVFLLPFLLYNNTRHSGKVASATASRISSKKDPGQAWMTWMLSALGIVFVMLIIFLSGSRSGLLAFGVEMIFFILLWLRVSLKRAVIISLLLVISCLSLPFLQKDVVYENRAEIWKSALIAGFENPFVGFGFGNTEIVLKKYNFKLFNNVQGYYVDSSHNFLLDWWVMAGGIGLSALSILLLDAIRQLIKQKKVLEMGLLLGVITIMLFNPVSVVTLITFWWLIGRGIAPSK